MGALRLTAAALLLLAAPAARAEDVRNLAQHLAEAYDCLLSAETLAAVAAPRHGAEEARAVIEAMVEAGEAVPVGSRNLLEVRPPLCTPSPDMAVSGASSWVEQWLFESDACRLPLEELARRAEAEGFAADSFDRALGALVQGGALAVETGDIVHLPCATPPSPPAGPLERIEAYGTPGFRGLVALQALRGGCRVPAEGREDWIETMTGVAAAQLDLAPPLAPEVADALRAAIAGVLDNPGPAYEIDPDSGDLVMVPCTP